MTGLVGPNGKPISSADFRNKKASPPALGERYGRWAGEDYQVLKLPGGGAIALDTSNLTLADFRQMKQHYQIMSSLSVLTFMMHQMDWHIISDDPRVAARCEENLNDVWSRLVRAKSQALWAGYSPNALQWENDTHGNAIVLTKIKDLYPEDCRVHWKKVKTATGPNSFTTFSIYDGIDQWGSSGPIPVPNSYWYPLLMENGNYYGRRLLESAFQPWFFSTLMHLFANRYYERFGEPVPVGRAPYEEEISVGGKLVTGNELMGSILGMIRNRSAVVLPNDRTPMGDENDPPFDYQIEYLESQMRGADFERYMTRLDEEMSLAMFTPILMMRTADVGSYNLGTQHTQVYQWMLNAISGDWAYYINKYILRPIVHYNFGPRAAPARIKFVRMGKIKAELLQAVVTELFQKNAVKYDVREIGDMAGLTLEQIDEVTGEETSDPPEESRRPDADTQDIFYSMLSRIEGQVNRSFRDAKFGTEDFEVKVGYRRQLAKLLKDKSPDAARAQVDDIFNQVEFMLNVAGEMGLDEFASSADFMQYAKVQVQAGLEAIGVVK